MRKPRATARRLAAARAAQEQFAELMQFGAPEEWAPFGEEEFSLMPVPAMGGDGEEEAGEQQDDEGVPPSFSHFASVDEHGRHYRRDFSSVKEYCEQPFYNAKNEALFKAEELDLNGDFPDYDLRKDKNNMDWYGARSAEVAMDRAFKGWPEGAERVRKMMEQVDAPPPVSMRRKLQRADQGDELDIHAVYRGNLDSAWTRRRRQHSRARMNVRIVAPIGGGHKMTAEEMFWRGAAVVKLAELIEESGYRVELVAETWQHIDARVENPEWTTENFSSFIMKDAGSPIDVEQVAGVLCNSGFFRTYCFRAQYAMVEHALRPSQSFIRKDGKQGMSTTLSRSYSASGDAVEKFGLAADGTKTFVAKLSITYADAARRWIKECLAELEQSNTQ